jgi:Uma2 family endonuclease
MSTAEAPAEAAREVRPLRRVEYDALVEGGFLGDEGVELIDGQLLYAADEGPDHARVIRRLNRLLIEALPAEEADVGVGNPIAVNDLSEPEPDFMVIEPGTYRGHHPGTASLVIEVSHSSLRYDLTVKARLYGSAGYPEYWVFDLRDQALVVHRDPVDGGYGTVQRHRDGSVQALHHPAVRVDVAALLG